MYVCLINPNNNRGKKIKLGFSLITLIFCPFVLLFRRLLYPALLEAVLLVLSVASAGMLCPVVIIYHIAFAFSCNAYYAKELVKRGWVPADEESRLALEPKP